MALCGDYAISTHTSLAGRDQRPDKTDDKHAISTHTSLAGRDAFTNMNAPKNENFYSHVPRGT